MRGRRSVLATATVAAALLIAACGGSGQSERRSALGDSGTRTEALKMYSLLGTSGDLAAVGQAQASAQRAAVAVVNAEGGVFGEPIELEVIDSTGSPTEAVAKTQQLLSEEDPAVVIPGTTTAEVSAMIPVLNDADVFVSHHGVDPEFDKGKEYPFVFGNAYLPRDQAASLADEFSKQGFENVGVVTSDNVTGRSGYEAQQAAYAEKGIESTVAYVPPSAVDATAQMQQVMAADPDVLLMDAYGPPAGAIIEARTTLGIDIPTYGSQYLTANNLADLGSESSYDGVTLQSLAVAVKGTNVTTSDAFKTMGDAVMQENDGTLTFTMNTYRVAYNDVILAAKAAELANSTDPQKMAEAIENATPEQIPNYVGPVNFSPENHLPVFGPDFWTFVPFGPIVDGLLVPEA